MGDSHARPKREWPLFTDRVVDMSLELFFVDGFEIASLFKLNIRYRNPFLSTSFLQGCYHGFFLISCGALLDDTFLQLVSVLMSPILPFRVRLNQEGKEGVCSSKMQRYPWKRGGHTRL